MDTRLKKLMKELGDAINGSLSESEQIAQAIAKIKEQGYDIFLVLEATIGFNRKTEEAASPAQTPPPASSPGSVAPPLGTPAAAEPTERLPSVRRDLDDLSAPIGRVAAPLDQTGLLELVEQADQLALVVAESVGDRALRLTRPLVEDGQDRVVVRMQAVFFVRVEGLLLGDHPEPFEQEKWRGDELLWKALRNRLRGSVGHGKKCSAANL